MGRPSSRVPIEPIEPMDLANMRQNDSTPGERLFPKRKPRFERGSQTQSESHTDPGPHDWVDTLPSRSRSRVIFSGIPAIRRLH
jgi:hypothetical protein